MKYEFVYYTKAPSTTDKNAIRNNGGYKGYASNRISGNGRKDGYVLPNCVGLGHAQWLYELTHALGLEEARRYEAMLCIGNAEDYYSHKDDLPRGYEPKLGGMMVWRGEGKLKGHVEVVVGIASNGDVTNIASNWSGSKYYTSHRTKSSKYKISSSYTYLGCIYPPVELAKFVTTPGVRSNKKDQIKISISNLNVRRDVDAVIKTGKTGTSAVRQGYAKVGTYDVLATVKDKNYTWYKIDKEGLWVASVKGVEFLPKKVVKYKVTVNDVPEEALGALKSALNDLHLAFISEQL